MSKARVTWAFQDLIASSTLNEMVTDDLTPGRLIHASSNLTSWMEDSDALNPGADRIVGTHMLGAYPFNAAKNVADRMRIIGEFYHGHTGGASTWVLEQTINGGAGWNNVTLPLALPIAAGTAAPVAGSGRITWSTVVTGAETVDVSGVVGSTWFGWRLRLTAANTTIALFHRLTVFLYNSVDTPF